MTVLNIHNESLTRVYRPKQPPKPTDLCTICYTSGTTGLPKGVMLTHGNVVAAVSAVLVQLSQYRPNVGDVMISYLPLAHMLERCCEVSEITCEPPVYKMREQQRRRCTYRTACIWSEAPSVFIAATSSFCLKT